MRIRTAERLATAYAQTFTEYRTELDTAPIVRAQDAVEANLDELRASGEARGPLYASLVAKLQQLKTFEALQTSNTYVVREAENATQVQPRPVRNAVLGVLLGLALGIGFAFSVKRSTPRAHGRGDQRAALPLCPRPRPPRKLEREPARDAGRPDQRPGRGLRCSAPTSSSLVSTATSAAS